MAGQRAGTDPTAAWRGQLDASTQEQYAVASPPATSAAFVLQWYCEVLATPAALAAVFTDSVVDVAPANVDFAVDPFYAYPQVVGLRSAETQRISDPIERRQRAYSVYAAHASEFARTYAPGVKMGSRQRNGMVGDMWARAWEAALAQVQGRGPVPQPRQSCCFIYALPGCQECAGCPRQGRASVRS
ncbi:MAG: (2Fe-2S)-binding protein [Micrococcales bacterium]|nr:(2Fe-2S)-binding protein [Micrococcales bacterium]